MADDVIEPESGQGNMIASIFKDHATTVRNELPEIKKEEWEKTRKTLSHVSSALPENVLIGGGTALRLHLEAKGYKVPEMPMMDIDIALAQEVYDRVRKAMPVSGDSDFQTAIDPLDAARLAILHNLFRRKGNEANFTKQPEKDMALEDKETFMHVDVFPADTTKMDVSMLTIDGQLVKVLSPEALFVTRVQQLAQIMREQGDKQIVEVPRKILQYLALNGSIVDDVKLKKVLTNNGIDLDPTAYTQQLDEQLRAGITSGRIVLVDSYH